MTIRITGSKDGDSSNILVEGRLDATNVTDLETECLSAGTPLRIDISSLLSADEDGLRVLRSLAQTGAELSGASPYMRELLFRENL